MSFFKDPLVRRFISASFFAASFVWVAVKYFNVETDVVWVLFVFSIIFVVGMIFIGLIGVPLVRLFRKKPSMLASIEEAEKSLEGSLEQEDSDRPGAA